MYKYGKTAQNAVSVASYLAGHCDKPDFRASSQAIADARELPKPLVAKILTVLSSADIIDGTTGPRGGYRFAVDPASVTLADITSLFEKQARRLVCPFGPNWCGVGPICPLHDQLLAMDAAFEQFLQKTTLDVFRGYTPPPLPVSSANK